MGDSLARWEDMVFSAGGLRGCEEKLAARSRFQQQVPGDDFKGDPETSQNIGAEWEIQTHAASLVVTLDLTILADMSGAQLVLTDQSISFSVHGLVARVAFPTRVDVSRCQAAKFSRRTRKLRVRIPILNPI
eukprot:COSAG02_NODE_1008_length_15238_cov_24.345928_9_plen_132_part_00